MKLWRCQNEDCSECPHGRLIFDFMNETGVCPKCSADPATPEGADLVVPRVVVHLLVKDKAGPIAGHGCRLKVACQPALKKLPTRATGSAAAVTCPLCLNTADYVAADAAAKPVEENAVPVGTPLAG